MKLTCLVTEKKSTGKTFKKQWSMVSTCCGDFGTHMSSRMSASCFPTYSAFPIPRAINKKAEHQKVASSLQGKKIIMNLLYMLLVSLFLSSCRADPLGNFCNENTNISSSSQISVNIDRLLAELVSKTPLTGYIVSSSGKDPDKVYGLAQCRGDVSNKDCSSCIQDAAKQVRQRCSNQADARIWYDYCFLRYSNDNFVGKVDTSFGIFYYNVENVTDPQSFNKELGALMDRIRSEAVMPKNEGLGKGKTKLSQFLTLYALVQCTRDLSQIDCSQCLAIAVGNFPNFCDSKKGCRVLYSSCYVRYELYPFFFPLDSNNGTSFGKTVKIIHH